MKPQLWQYGFMMVFNSKEPLLAETCSYFFLLLNTIINPYYLSCGSMTGIYSNIIVTAMFQTVILDNDNLTSVRM